MYYTIEKKEGKTWVPKVKFNFEDSATFSEYAQKQDYRILCEQKDITDRYLNNREMTKVSVDKPSSQIKCRRKLLF